MTTIQSSPQQAPNIVRIFSPTQQQVIFIHLMLTAAQHALIREQCSEQLM